MHGSFTDVALLQVVRSHAQTTPLLVIEDSDSLGAIELKFPILCYAVVVTFAFVPHASVQCPPPIGMKCVR